MQPTGDPSNRLSIETDEDRYSRLRMMPWWDQDLLRRAKVMVVGAGALGNEIVKDLALLGIGSMLIVDFDSIETSNLSRSVLYRHGDEGVSKAHTAAAAARAINPECQVFALNADITCEVGLGVFRWADVVIGGLDNREARLAVNQACWKVNRPWVDGATESLQGVARVFHPPDGVCYECTLSEQDRRLMDVRNSCGFLAREAYRQGRTPTTPTTAAVIAGVEVNEAVKLLHGASELPALIGRGFFFDGDSYECFTIDYTRRDDCLSHETYGNIVPSDLHSESTALRDVIREAERRTRAAGGVVELPCEMVTSLRCTECGSEEELHRLLASVEPDEARCPECGRMRVPEVVAECGADAPFAGIPLARLGFGVMEIIPVCCDSREVQIEISGDFGMVFGGAH